MARLLRFESPKKNHAALEGLKASSLNPFFSGGEGEEGARDVAKPTRKENTHKVGPGKRSFWMEFFHA